MAQTAKVIDITRTYLPIDPAAFPEGMNGPSNPADPNKIPVSAYIAKNVLPTPHGYKSYFGINQSIGVDPIDGRVDHVFIFQNATLKNILVALCDNGMWIKTGSTSGAWSLLDSMEVPTDPNIHNPWTYCVISNILYCYQAGRPYFLKVTSDLSEIGIAAGQIIPSFLNMSGQLGIFKAGGRLGFWDSEGSISWSDLDTKADFEPSLETLAGYATFADVKGKIVNILPHGQGFIIYSTSSVVGVYPDTSGSYQWQAAAIMQDVGITYPRQTTTSNPDTVHFVLAGAGLYRIEKMAPELIAPEAAYYLRSSRNPVYLRVLENHLLYLEIMDGDFEEGNVQWSEGQTIPLTYNFPQSQMELPSGGDFCSTLAGITDGLGVQPEHAPEDKKPGTRMKPIWTCYLSKGGNLDADNLTFGPAPCAVPIVKDPPYYMNPIGVHQLADYADPAKKVAVSGASAYVDGTWTMERFVAVQTAIWRQEDANKAKFLSKIANRAVVGKTITMGYSEGPIDFPTASSECTSGRYAGEFTGAYFDYNPCSFWLTRYAVSAYDLKVVYTQRKKTVFENPVTMVPPTAWGLWPAAASFPTLEAAKMGNNLSGASIELVAGALTYVGPGSVQSTPSYSVADGSGRGFYAIWTAPAGLKFTPDQPGISMAPMAKCVPALPYSLHEDKTAYNKLVPVQISPTPDTAWCEVTGYSYTKNDNTTGTVSVSACDLLGGAKGGSRNNGAKRTVETRLKADSGGGVCGVPWQENRIGVDSTVESIVVPGGSFLLQDGTTEPVYPTRYGALVYDLHLKKWGKMIQPYSLLFDYAPINAQASMQIGFGNSGAFSGILSTGSTLHLFDEYPVDAYITYGKIGYYKVGNTSAEEVHAHFRDKASGSLEVTTSLDGRHVATMLSSMQEFKDTDRASIYGCFPGTWQNITISGHFDITYLEYRGFIKGRR